jgi:hypothetical protein
MSIISVYDNESYCVARTMLDGQDDHSSGDWAFEQDVTEQETGLCTCCWHAYRERLNTVQYNVEPVTAYRRSFNG